MRCPDTLVAQASLTAYEWFSPWIPATGLSSFIATLKNKNVQGDFRSKVAVQWATVRTDDPSAGGTYGSALSGAGELLVASGDISTTSAAEFFVRFGAQYDLSTGSTAASADVELQVSYDMCGQIIGVLNEQRVATSTTKLFRATGPWVPALHATKIKTAVVCNSLEGNLQWRMTYRTATTSKESPSAWEADWEPSGMGSNPNRTNGEFNTGEFAPSLSGKMWVQPGLQYNLSSGSTPGQASFVLTTAVRK